MKTLLKILKWTGIVILLLIAGLVTVVLATWNKTYDAPMPDIQASTDSAVIARGEYLVFGPAHCNECHTDMEGYKKSILGEHVPLSGGFAFKLPFGTVYSRNITNDKETGIGRYTDGEIARAIRYGVKPDGHVLMPFMQYHTMTDDDLTAVISYLRTTEPVKKEIQENSWTFMGKAVLAFFIRPTGPATPPAKTITPSVSKEYGEYLATGISNCNGCHTPIDFRTGKPIGPAFSGGNKMESATLEEGVFVYTPNITPDPETGRITKWTEQEFVDRFHEGKKIPESIMPWGPYKNFSDDDLRSIYMFLMSLPPTNHVVPSDVVRE